MAQAYTVQSKVFERQEQAMDIVTKHFLWFKWEIRVPVGNPKRELIVFIQEKDDINKVIIQNGKGVPIEITI